MMLWPGREGRRRPGIGASPQRSGSARRELPGAPARPAGAGEPAGQAAGGERVGDPPAQRRPGRGHHLEQGGVTWARSSHPVKGLGVTFSHMFRRSSPTPYPDGPSRSLPRYHGRHILNRHPDGLESASGASCARGPARRTRSTSRARTTPRRSATRRASGTDGYQINYAAASSAGCASRHARPVRSP